MPSRLAEHYNQEFKVQAFGQARQLHSSDNEFLSNASGCAVSGCITIPENKVLPQGFTMAHHHADKVPPRVHSGACNCHQEHQAPPDPRF